MAAGKRASKKRTKNTVAKKTVVEKAVVKKAAPNKAAPKKQAAPKPAHKRHRPNVSPSRTAVERLREICLALPETSEIEAWGEPTFRVKGKIFAMHASSGTHHSPERPAVWILSVSVEQDFVVRARPDRYFKPPYVGPSGWIGAWLDQNPPWGEIEELVRDGWRRRAPKKIAALLPD